MMSEYDITVLIIKGSGNSWKVDFRHVSPRFKAFILLEMFF